MDQLVTFNSLLDTMNTLDVSAGFSVGNIFFSLLIALFVSLFLGFVYRYTFQGVLYSKSFNVSLITISLITTVVIMTISGNLILSLGMVGALSIVRFRTAVKDPIDLTYMFWAITVGIANGVGFYKLSIVGSLFIALVLLVLQKKRYFKVPYICVFKTIPSSIDVVKKQVNDIVGTYKVRSIQVVGDHIECIVAFRGKQGGETELVKQLANIQDVVGLHLIANDGNVETVT